MRMWEDVCQSQPSIHSDMMVLPITHVFSSGPTIPAGFLQIHWF